jgi:hypothetical protein
MEDVLFVLKIFVSDALSGLTIFCLIAAPRCPEKIDGQKSKAV